MSKLQRRQILIAVCGLFTAWGFFGMPIVAEAQQVGKVYHIGFLSFPPIPNAGYEAFRQGLGDLKYVEGRNIVMVTRSAEGRRDRLPQLASELVAAKVDVIVVTTGTAALAVKSATSSIPIVMTASADAVTMGIVKSLARPGGNVTGFTIISPDLAPKRLQMLASLPGLTRVAVLWCPVGPINHEELRRTSAAATQLGIQVEPVEYQQGSTTWQSLQGALDRARPQALFLLDCTSLPFQQILDFAIQRRLPTISPYVQLGEMGVLLAYGPDTVPMARRAASLVDKILKGASPADLPVEQPTEFELVVNVKTARAIGVTFPQSILVRASRVIE